MPFMRNQVIWAIEYQFSDYEWNSDYSEEVAIQASNTSDEASNTLQKVVQVASMTQKTKDGNSKI